MNQQCVRWYLEPAVNEADCDSASMRWNEETKVCSDSTSTIGQTEAKPKSAASTKGSGILIAIDKATQKMSCLSTERRNTTGAYRPVGPAIDALLGLTLPRP